MVIKNWWFCFVKGEIQFFWLPEALKCSTEQNEVEPSVASVEMSSPDALGGFSNIPSWAQFWVTFSWDVFSSADKKPVTYRSKSGNSVLVLFLAFLKKIYTWRNLWHFLFMSRVLQNYRPHAYGMLRSKKVSATFEGYRDVLRNTGMTVISHFKNQ